MGRQMVLALGGSASPSGWTTPMTLLTTRNGCIPHLTQETLEQIGLQNQPVLVAINWFIHNVNNLKQFNKGKTSVKFPNEVFLNRFAFRHCVIHGFAGNDTGCAD